MAVLGFYGQALLIIGALGATALALAVPFIIRRAHVYGEFMGLRSSRAVEAQTTRVAQPKQLT